MKICTACHAENPDDALLCAQCGGDITTKYIRRHRVRHKRRRSRATKRGRLGIGAIALGVLLLCVFAALIVLMVYYTVAH